MENLKVTDIVALSTLSASVVEQCTRIAVRAASNWYTQQTSLEEFSLVVNHLRLKEEEWRQVLKRYGMTDHQELKARLDDAMRRLEEEEARVSQFKQSRFQRWWNGVSSLMFPDELSTSIRRVSDAFDDILKHLKEKSKVSDLLRRVALHTPSRLAFDLDEKYVPMESTLKSLVTALEDEDGPDVIILHGGPGTGKSSLARYLAVQYQNGPSGEITKARRFPGATVGQTVFPDGVFFQPCGRRAESIDCHRDLLLMLGLWIPKSEEGKEPKEVLAQLNDQLHEGLRDLSTLIIFDDVWDPKLLESLLLPGRTKNRRKYLITSQDAHIWRNSTCIPMEAVALDDARSILATHVGFPDKQIPLNLQPIADSLIEQTGANPLALASLALAIGKKGRHDEQKWIAVEEDLVLLLEEETLPQQLMYPTTVASSIMLALRSVPPEALELLYLASLCESPAVPEVVMRTFYCFLNGGPRKFIQWTDYLESSSLVQVQDYKFAWSMVRQKTWSVHSLRQFFIRDKKTEDLQTLTDRLLGLHKDGEIDTEEVKTQQDLVIALCAVYGCDGEEMGNDYGLVERAAQRFGISTREVRQRKTFIKELVWCLHSESNDKWRHDSTRIGRKVILHFLRHGDLDEKDLLDLLALNHDHACSTACWALGALLGTEEGLFVTFGRYKKFLRRLLALTDQTSLPLSRETAAHALMKFTVRKDEKRKEQLLQFLSMPNCLQTLVKLVGKDTESYAVRQCAASLLGNLATVEENKMAIGALPEAIEALAKLATEDSTAGKEVQVVFGLQPIGHAARVLANIAAADDHRIALDILASHPNLVHVLINSLTNKDYSGLRESAVRALAALQTARENMNIIGSSPNVLENLVAVLDDDENPGTQKCALVALIRLAQVADYRVSVTKIFNSKETLVRLLKTNDPELNEAAAMAVGYLVLTPGCDLMKRNTSAALRGLVFLLGADDADVSYRAASLLSFSVYKEKENKKLLLDVPRVLEGVIGLLAEARNPDQQAAAGNLLSILLEDNPDVSLRVLAIPHTLDRLVRVVSDRYYLDPAVYAALVIGRLAQSVEAQRIIVNHPKVFESLVKLLDEGQEELYRTNRPPPRNWSSFFSSFPMRRLEDFSFDMRTTSGWSISNSGFYELRCNQRHLHQQALSTLIVFLSCLDVALQKRNQIQILAVHDQGALRSSIRLLNDHGSSDQARTMAIMVMSCLALPTVNKSKVAACPGVFETLFKALTMKDTTRKAHAARTLSNIFINKQGMGSLRSVPGAVDNLAKMLLGEYSNPSMRLAHQRYAAMSMVNLTASRANKLVVARTSRALSSILQTLNHGQETSPDSRLPLAIRQMAVQILANLASIQENRDILLSFASSRSSVLPTLCNLLGNDPESMMQYLAAYTAARLDWEMISSSKLGSPEALLGRANAGIEMKRYALALADLRTLGVLETRPNVPYLLTFPHLWYSTCSAIFCIRVLSACNGARMPRLPFKHRCEYKRAVTHRSLLVTSEHGLGLRFKPLNPKLEHGKV